MTHPDQPAGAHGAKQPRDDEPEIVPLLTGELVTLNVGGRDDICGTPRAIARVRSMLALESAKAHVALSSAAVVREIPPIPLFEKAVDQAPNYSQTSVAQHVAEWDRVCAKRGHITTATTDGKWRCVECKRVFEDANATVEAKPAQAGVEQSASPEAQANFTVMTMRDLLTREKRWSAATFGPGRHTNGLTKHIEKECAEVRGKPADLIEWVDIMMLAWDGFWRAGGTVDDLPRVFGEKLAVNEARQWPAVTSEDEPIEHIKEASPPPIGAGEGGGASGGNTPALASASAPPTPPQLLACPFCGQMPRTKWHGAVGEDDDAGYWGIDCCVAHAHADTEADATFLWNNRRAPLPAAGEGKEGVNLDEINRLVSEVALIRYELGLNPVHSLRTFVTMLWQKGRDAVIEQRGGICEHAMEWAEHFRKRTGLYRSGQRVETQEGAGVVKQIVGDAKRARQHAQDLADDDNTPPNMVNSFISISACLERAASTATALAAQVETLTRERDNAREAARVVAEHGKTAEASLSAMGEKVGKMEAVVKAAKAVNDKAHPLSAYKRGAGTETEWNALDAALATLSTAAAKTDKGDGE